MPRKQNPKTPLSGYMKLANEILYDAVLVATGRRRPIVSATVRDSPEAAYHFLRSARADRMFCVLGIDSVRALKEIDRQMPENEDYLA